MKTGKIILVGIGAGLLASWLKSIAEPPLQKAGLHYFPATDEELEMDGADISGHPENMPPAVLAKKLYGNFTGHQLKDESAVKAMSYIHYALGIVMSVAYVFARDKNKNAALAEGFPAGLAMFALTHGSTVPALDLQGKVKEMPKSWWVWEFGSHLLFGFFLEQSTKVFKKVF